MFLKLRKLDWVASNIGNFKEAFPELNKMQNDEILDRLESLNIEFYTEKENSVNSLMRLTLPFALIVAAIMLFGLPVLFLITGEWKYPFTKLNTLIYNWFKLLKIFY